MESSSIASPKKNRVAGAWAGTVIFVVAVVAVLIYVSSEKHDMKTLIVLAAVLLVGQIAAILQWLFATRKEASQIEDPFIIRKMDERMMKSFANQEIIHNEIHANHEAITKRLEAMDNAQKYLANRLDEADKTPRAIELNAQAIEKIATIVAEKMLAGTLKIDLAETSDEIEESTNRLVEEIRKISETNDERYEKIAQAFNEKIEKIALKPCDSKRFSELNERLDTLALNQENVLEKLEQLEILPDDPEDAEEESEENIEELNERTGDATDDDEAFPLPEKMLERARSANATTGTIVEKMIAENTRTEVSEVEEIADKADASEDADELKFDDENVPIVMRDEISEKPIPTPSNESDPELEDLEDLPHTALILRADFASGEKPFLRGNAPGLSPEKATPMEYSGNSRWRFDFGPMKNDAEITLFLNDSDEKLGDPFMLPAGKITTLSFTPDA